MGKIVLNDEEKVLVARVNDLIQKCDKENRAVFSDFLSDREKVIVLEETRGAFPADRVIVYGGFEDAERTIVGFFPEYSMFSDVSELYEEFPIKAVKIVCSGFREHSHRDFLGSVLGLGLERTVIGDIVPDEKGYSATVFVHEKIVSFLTENLRLIGRDGVNTTLCTADDVVELKRNYEPITGTVASFRIDAVISEVLNISREKSVKLIEAGLVTVNHAVVLEKSEELKCADVFTVRGSGKFRLSEIGTANRKGRIRFLVEKFV